MSRLNMKVEGIDELEKTLQQADLTQAQINKAMKLGLEILEERARKDTPVKSGRLKDALIVEVKRAGYTTQGIVKYKGVWHDIINEFGSPTNRKHVGFFSNAIKKSEDKAIKILADELLSKIR